MLRPVPVLFALVLLSCGRTAVFDSALPQPQPVAVILPGELTTLVGQKILLNGANSRDPLGEPLVFHWRIRTRPQTAAAVLAASEAQSSFIPDQSGAWSVELIVSAGNRMSEPAVARIVAVTPSANLVANAGPDQTGRVGETFSLDGTLSFDPGGQPISFSWSLASAVGSSSRLFGATGANPFFVADRSGTYKVQLTVSAGGRTASDEVVVRVDASNHPPVASAGSSQNVPLGAVVRLDGSASSDPDGDAIIFSWRSVASPRNTAVTLSDSASLAPTFTATEAGAYVFEVLVDDGRGGTDQDTTTVTALFGIDGGADGGLADGGDAGSLDGGGRDGGNVDGGNVDAGAFDAGSVDSGPVGPGDVLDDGDVYLVGTLMEGSCAHDALALIGSPDLPSTGLDCYFDGRSAMVRPVDGRMIYTNSFEDVVREYHCDACLFAGTYPTQVLANDPIIATTCSNGKVTGFKVSADGLILHTCDQNAAVLRDGSGAVLIDGTTDRVLAVGSGGWVLSQTRVVNVLTLEEHPISGLPATSWLATRWSSPDGFFVAISTASQPQLWRVATAGTAQLVGNFPAPVSGFTILGGSRLDRGGRLYQLARESAHPLIDAIIRSQVGASSVVAYTEASNPRVRITPFSSLVTGP